MDRSDTPTLLLPLLALLAIAFPFAMFRTPASSGGNKPQASQATKQEVNKEGSGKGRKAQPHTAARLIEEFLQARSHPANWLGDDPRKEYSLDFMVAIVADPIDSRLPRMFDSSVDSIQRAFEADGYVLDRFDLAWSEPASVKTDTGKTPGTGVKLEERIPRYRWQPSLLLFRRPPDLEKEAIDPKNEAYKGKLFLVFLVGETPTSGIHKAAMTSALYQLASFYPWGAGHKELPKSLYNLVKDDSSQSLNIRIMGPSFSGSATSLEFSLRDWLSGLRKDVRVRVNLRIVSGSATSIDPKEFCKLHAGGPQTFQAVVPPDDVAMPVIYNYIHDLGFKYAYNRIALLAEGGTAYGRANINRRDASQNDKGQGEGKKDAACTQEHSKNKEKSNECKPSSKPEVIYLPFPLHISELRTESEKQRESQQASNSSLPNTLTPWVHLNEKQSSQPKETPPSFSSLGAASSELVLSQLLSTISHEEIHAVGILATDVRDVLFLAREIHQHCPGTLVFTVFSDLLFSHPEVSTSTRGMLVFTPYPLYNPNQVWTPPHWGLVSRIQFRSQDAEGAYNATLALLDRNDLLLDYGQPFSSRPANKGENAKPALWVTVVGRNGPLPVRTLSWPDCEKYSVRVTSKDFADRKGNPPQPPTLNNEEGIYTANITIGIALLSLLLGSLSVLIILRYRAPAGLESEDGSGWTSRLLGEPVTTGYNRQSRLFLIACLVCLLCADLILAVVYFLPALASVGAGIKGWFSWAFHSPVAIITAAGLFLLSLAVAVVLRAFHNAPRHDRFLQVAVKRLIFWACLVAFVPTLRMVLVWLCEAWSSPTEAISTYVRALAFFSGLSPLVPLFCVALAGFLWAFCSFKRLRMIDGIRPVSHENRGDEYLLRMETQTFSGVEDLENKVRGTLERASVLPTGWHAVAIVVPLLTFAWIYLFVSTFVPSYEGIGFYFLFGWGFLLVFVALTTEFSRLCLAWAAFRHLLHRLALHPMREAFGRYRASFAGLHRIDLAMPLQTLSILSFSVDQAERLLRMASSLASSRDLYMNQRQNLKQWIVDAQREVSSAAESFSKALDADGKGKWRLVIEERSRAQSALGTLTQMTAGLLEPSWRAAKSTNSLSKEQSEFQEFRRLGEEFLVGRVVLLISYVLPALRKLGTFVLIGLVLMLFSVMFYPFVQKNHFLAFDWVVILGFVVLALVVMLQMERDVVLSALNGTTPGQVKISRQFTFRVLTYVMVPILLLLSAQFPDSLGQIVSWFSRFQGH